MQNSEIFCLVRGGITPRPKVGEPHFWGKNPWERRTDPQILGRVTPQEGGKKPSKTLQNDTLEANREENREENREKMPTVYTGNGKLENGSRGRRHCGRRGGRREGGRCPQKINKNLRTFFLKWEMDSLKWTTSKRTTSHRPKFGRKTPKGRGGLTTI